MKRGSDLSAFSKKHHLLIMSAGILFLIIFIYFLISPALLGYRLSKAFDSEDLTSDDVFNKLNTIDVLESKNKDLTSEVESLSKQIAEKDSLISNLTKNISNQNFELNLSNSNIKNLNSEITTQKSQLLDLTKQLDDVYRNWAINKCCKEKVDNSKIDSYLVIGNTIHCSSDEPNKIIC